MKTTQVVKDGIKLPAEQEETLARRYRDLKRRIAEGTIDFDWAKSEIQRIQEGRKAKMIHHWPNWHTVITTEGLKPTTEVIALIKKSGIALKENVEELIGHEEFVKHEVPMKVELVRVKLADLGLARRRQVQLKEARERGIELGLLPCPNTVVVELCVEHQAFTYDWYPHIVVSDPLFVGVNNDVAATFKISTTNPTETVNGEWVLDPQYYRGLVSDYEQLIFARSVEKADMRPLSEVYPEILGGKPGN